MAARIAFILIVVLFSRCLPAQSVISNRAGLVLYLEGEVLIDGQSIEPVHARYPQLRSGSLLCVGAGRVEILMAPGVLLWLGPHSSARMRNVELSDARIEFLNGSLMMQTTELLSGNEVTVSYKGAEIQAKAHTVYRNNVPPEIDRWAQNRARAIALQNAMAARKHKHSGGSSRPFPSAIPALPGRT